MADALARAKRPDDARLAYEQFVQFFPNSELRATARFRVALMDFEAKDYARAAVAFTQVLDESTSVEAASAAQYNLALCQRMLGQSDDARATLEAYRQKHPRDARAADIACQLGDLAETAGRADDAAHEYEAGLACPARRSS
jgi:TolA-binding protein